MPGLVARVRAIILTPHTEWMAIGREEANLSALFAGYVAILAAIPSLARFIGGSLIGGYTPVLPGLIDAIVGYLLSFVLVYAVALTVNTLAPTFTTERDLIRALRLTAYAYTPVWLAGIFQLVPGLSFLNVLGLYGAYLLWAGLPAMMGTPPRIAMLYAAAVAAVAFLLEIVARLVLAAI